MARLPGIHSVLSLILRNFLQMCVSMREEERKWEGGKKESEEREGGEKRRGREERQGR